MSVRTMDGVRTKRLPVPARRRTIIAYPDLTELIGTAPSASQEQHVVYPVEQHAPVAAAQSTAIVQPSVSATQVARLPVERTSQVMVQPVEGVVARPAKRRAVRVKKQRAPKLKVVRRSMLKSGLSWFMVCAVLSASAIGLFSVFEKGRAAKDAITEQAGTAEAALSAAAAALVSQEPDQALAEFDKASASFSSIQAEIDKLSATVRAAAAPLPGDPVGAADTLAQAGIHVATAGSSLTKIVQEFNGVDLATVVGQPDVQGATSALDASAESKTLTDVLIAVQPEVEVVGRELTEAGRLVMAVDTRGLPDAVAGPVAEMQAQLPAVLDQLKSVGGLVSVLAEVAGATTARTYAVVFQNPNELRPTGGFWGQLAFVKLQHGQVEKIDIKSIYDPAGQVTSRQTPPEGLDVISESFALQDANWYPDFATSARVLLSFLSETGDPRLDGVIALNPTVVTDLLSLTGPVSIDELGLTVTEDTFVEEAQYEVADKDPERDRTFFPDFTEQFLGKVFALDRDHWLAVAQSLMQAVARKDIQIFFGDQTLTALPETLGADGVLPREVDLVAPVVANVGGGKTDQYVTESRALRVTVGEQFIRHELEIVRTDTRTDQFKDRDNRSYLRVYVPKGAELRSASGFDTDVKALIAHDCTECEPALGTPLEEHVRWEAGSNTKWYEEAGHTVLANWVTLAPGEERRITVTYDVPREAVIRDGQMQLYLWRQPGSSTMPLDLEVTSDAGAIEYVSGAQQVESTGGTVFARKLVQDRDHVVGIVLQ